MIFLTSACDFPQNEHNVIRDDLAMEKYPVYDRFRSRGRNLPSLRQRS